MTTDKSEPRPDHAFSARAGEAWARLQERTDAWLDGFGQAALARLAPRPGERVIDVGCGTGQTVLQLAQAVGPAGHVLGVDISEQMLARARERAAAYPQVTLTLADAQTHPFAPASVDALFSRFGVMFFPDARAAFTNLRRALRPGGRLAFVCWQELARNPWAAAPLRAVLDVLGDDALPDILRPGRPGPFLFADTDRVQGILRDAGFADVAIAPVAHELNMGAARTLEEAVDYARQMGPAARAMADAPAGQQPALDAALTTALSPYARPDGVWMDGAALVVTATVRAA